MKVAVVGAGHVGLAVFGKLKSMAEINELVLIGADFEKDKVQGEIEDYLDGDVLERNLTPKISGGSYSAADGADIIIYAAGAGRKPNETRLDLLKKNVQILRDVFAQLRPYCQDAIIICISNPLDVITYLLPEVAGVSPEKVIGTGTLLDSARLRRLVARIFDINAASVHANVLGEHGQSAVVLWSAVRIGGLSVDQYTERMLDEEAVLKKKQLAESMKTVGARLITEKGSTAYGVTSSTARIVGAVIHDSREIMTVSTSLLQKYGVDGAAMSIPCVLGRQGILDTIRTHASAQETAALAHSAAVIKEAIASVKTDETAKK
jgi:L-lactate dehydrogenase